jgi:hypothetical protein
MANPKADPTTDIDEDHLLAPDFPSIEPPANAPPPPHHHHTELELLGKPSIINGLHSRHLPEQFRQNSPPPAPGAQMNEDEEAMAEIAFALAASLAPLPATLIPSPLKRPWTVLMLTCGEKPLTLK